MIKRTIPNFLLVISITLCFGLKAQVQIGQDIDGVFQNDQSGWSVDMPNANTVAVGSYLNDANGINSGQVIVYQYNGVSWVPKGQPINGEGENDRSGWSVSMPDANTVAIGAYLNDGNGTNAGHVRVFSWNGSAWVQKGSDIDGAAANDYFGRSVSMSNANTIAVGAILNDDNGFNSGSVEIFEWNGTAWVNKGTALTGDGVNDQFGYSVSMPDANMVAVGAINNNDNGVNAGCVKVFEWNGTSWVQLGSTLFGDAPGDQLGWSVDMPNNNTLAMGAIGNDFNGTDAGQVKVYSWVGSWIPKGNVIYGPQAGDKMGWSISMPSGNTIALGMPNHLDNGEENGKVEVRRWNPNVSWNWLPKVNNIQAEANADMWGFDVSMPNINTVAGSAIANDGNGANSGHVRVYDVCVTTFGTDTHVACDNFTWINGTTYFTSNNSATVTLVNADGCDSIVTLNLTILNSTSGVDQITACDNYTWIDGNTYFSNNSSASVTLTNSVGCDSTVFLDLTILNTTTSTDTHIACDEFTWINGVTYTNSNNTAQFFTTNAEGCDSIITLDLTINNSPASTVSLAGTTLTADHVGGFYQWLNCEKANPVIGGQNAQSFTPTSTGNYAVEITDNGCTVVSDCINLTILGLDESEKIGYNVYPNPAQNEIFIEDISAEATVMMINTQGQEIQLENKGESYDISGLAPGVYMLYIADQGYSATERIVKMR